VGYRSVVHLFTSFRQSQRAISQSLPLLSFIVLQSILLLHKKSLAVKRCLSTDGFDVAKSTHYSLISKSMTKRRLLVYSTSEILKRYLDCQDY